MIQSVRLYEVPKCFGEGFCSNTWKVSIFNKNNMVVTKYYLVLYFLNFVIYPKWQSCRKNKLAKFGYKPYMKVSFSQVPTRIYYKNLVI
jgi:hypothetical protein